MNGLIEEKTKELATNLIIKKDGLIAAAITRYLGSIGDSSTAPPLAGSTRDFAGIKDRISSVFYRATNVEQYFVDGVPVIAFWPPKPEIKSTSESTIVTLTQQYKFLV